MPKASQPYTFNFRDWVWLFVLLPNVGVIPASPSVIFLHKSKNSPQKADYFKTHFRDIHIWIAVVLCGISSFEPAYSFTGALLSLYICSLSVDNTVSCRQISVLLFTHVTMVVSVWELQTHTSVGVQQAMEAPTVRWVSSAKLTLWRLTTYMSRTAPVTSKRCILYIYSTNVGTEYFKHALYSPFFFLFKMQFVS